MNAVDKEKVVSNLIDHGAHIFGRILNGNKAAQLYERMLQKRQFGSGLFLSEIDYLKQETHFNANPTIERNFLNLFEPELQFVEKDLQLQSSIKHVLGDDYEIVIKKAICGVPFEWLPEWVAKKVANVNVANLGAYIKPEYRDITYFRGIDYHQDIIDWPKETTDLDPASFITVYVYLHEVSENDSPLHLLSGSHKLGATLFPHQLVQEEPLQWGYQDDAGRKMNCDEWLLTGGAGFVGMWHNCTLHGTQPVKSDDESMRLSLRYLLAKSNKNKKIAGINRINESINGNLSPSYTRKDLDTKGKAKIQGNVINQ